MRYVRLLRLVFLSTVFIVLSLRFFSPNHAEKINNLTKSIGIDLSSVDIGSALSGAGLSNGHYRRENATFVTLVKEDELWSLIGTIKDIEYRFNERYNYDWVFLNDGDFSEKFKNITNSFVSGNTYFGKIDKNQWSYPSHIDKDKAAKTRKEMGDQGIIYGDSESYRLMCRYNSGFFFKHPLLANYQYYWRVEPHAKFTCDIPEDPFKFMRENNKMYGFTIALKEKEETIKTLWKTVKNFMEKYPEHLAANNTLAFVSDDKGETYNMCHFWSNFEIANLDLWRSNAYNDFFKFLDEEGGFFYERWGDAPVHSIAASLFINKEQLHYFEDIGYYHKPHQNCPLSKERRRELRCTCPNDDDIPEGNHAIFYGSWKSCDAKFLKVTGRDQPKGWDEKEEKDK